MSPRMSSAYVLSLLLHAAVIALIVLLTYVADETRVEAPKVFELVAGPGDNYAATEAPAIGNPDATSVAEPAGEQAPAVTMPPVPQPVLPPEPPAPEAPVEEAAPIKPAPQPAPSTAKAAPQKVPNFAKNLKRIERKRADRLIRKYKKQIEAEREREEKAYQDYLRKHGVKGGAGAEAKGMAGGVEGGSRSNTKGGAGGTAMSREESDALDAYFALLKQRLSDNLVAPPDASDQLHTTVEFYLSASGAMSRPRIVTSSGNPAFDQAVVDAFERTHSIGPRPDGKGEMVSVRLGLHDEGE